MLLLIILTLLVLLFLLSSPLLLYRLNGMALSWLCFDSWTSQLRRAHRQRQTLWDFLFYQEECSRRGGENQTPSFLSVNPAKPVPCSPKRWNAVQNGEEGEGESSIFKTAVTVFFVQHGFEIFETFQKQESQVRYLPAHSQRYIFDFEIKLNEKKKSNLQMNVFSSHRENISALFKIKNDSLEKT